MQITDNTLEKVKQAKRRIRDRKRYKEKQPYTALGELRMYNKEKKQQSCAGCKSKDVMRYHGVWLCPSCIRLYERTIEREGFECL